MKQKLIQNVNTLIYLTTLSDWISAIVAYQAIRSFHGYIIGSVHINTVLNYEWPQSIKEILLKLKEVS